MKEETALRGRLQKSVVDIVAEQKKLGVDIPNDGEFGKPMRSAPDLAAWGTYIFGRMSGFGPKPAGAEAPGKAVSGQPTRIVGLRWEQREFPGFFIVLDGEVRHRVEPRHLLLDYRWEEEDDDEKAQHRSTLYGWQGYTP
jgi:hypothetical protein